MEIILTKSSFVGEQIGTFDVEAVHNDGMALQYFGTENGVMYVKIHHDATWEISHGHMFLEYWPKEVE